MIFLEIHECDPAKYTQYLDAFLVTLNPRN
jgi:hypothetical protein